jgi:hypothetical protein
LTLSVRTAASESIAVQEALIATTLGETLSHTAENCDCSPVSSSVLAGWISEVDETPTPADAGEPQPIPTTELKDSANKTDSVAANPRPPRTSEQRPMSDPAFGPATQPGIFPDRTSQAVPTARKRVQHLCNRQAASMD